MDADRGASAWRVGLAVGITLFAVSVSRPAIAAVDIEYQYDLLSQQINHLRKPNAIDLNKRFIFTRKIRLRLDPTPQTAPNNRFRWFSESSSRSWPGALVLLSPSVADSLL